jgi:predicted nucleic acid-binding protein
VTAYVDTSVLLRVILGEPGVLPEWSTLDAIITSELTRVEALRTIDRARLALQLPDEDVALRREGVFAVLRACSIARVDAAVLARAAEPFPTALRTLAAIHLATALLVRAKHEHLVFATHDRQQAVAARAVGFRLLFPPSVLRNQLHVHPDS